MIYLYVGVCFVFPWTVESFPFMFWRWRITNLNELPSSFLLPPHYCGLEAGSIHPFKGHCEQKAMRDEGVIYVVGHPLLNRKCQ